VNKQTLTLEDHAPSMAEASMWLQIESLAQMRFREFMHVARAIAGDRDSALGIA
jgi:hypothetical protein